MLKFESGKFKELLVVELEASYMILGRISTSRSTNIGWQYLAEAKLTSHQIWLVVDESITLCTCVNTVREKVGS